jgi:hypothetical protein
MLLPSLTANIDEQSHFRGAHFDGVELEGRQCALR